MRRVRGGWLSFRRIHLAALIADWRRTLLSVVGVALGVTVVLGVLVLKAELARPFDSFGPSLTHAAKLGVVEVTPNVSGRLPLTTVDRLHSDVAGAEAVIPVVADLTPVNVAGGGTHGFFLLGGSCQIELLVGSFNCEQRARNQSPANGPGAPLELPAVIAQRLGLRLGDVKVGERRLFMAEGKGGHQRIVPISQRFFATLARYLTAAELEVLVTIGDKVRERLAALQGGSSAAETRGHQPR